MYNKYWKPSRTFYFGAELKLLLCFSSAAKSKVRYLVRPLDLCPDSRRPEEIWFLMEWSEPEGRDSSVQTTGEERGLSDIVDILVKKAQDIYNVRETMDRATRGHAAVFGKDPGGKLNCVKILLTVQKFDGSGQISSNFCTVKRM